jgi:hypothetical protein
MKVMKVLSTPGRWAFNAGAFSAVPMVDWEFVREGMTGKF